MQTRSFSVQPPLTPAQTHAPRSRPEARGTASGTTADGSRKGECLHARRAEAAPTAHPAALTRMDHTRGPTRLRDIGRSSGSGLSKSSLPTRELPPGQWHARDSLRRPTRRRVRGGISPPSLFIPVVSPGHRSSTPQITIPHPRLQLFSDASSRLPRPVANIRLRTPPSSARAKARGRAASSRPADGCRSAAPASNSPVCRPIGPIPAGPIS